MKKVAFFIRNMPEYALKSETKYLKAIKNNRNYSVAFYRLQNGLILNPNQDEKDLNT